MTRRLLTMVVLCLGLVGLGGQAAQAAADDTGLGDGAGTGIPSGSVVLAVLAVLGGLGATIWRMSLARQIARQSGMDPDQATAVTLLSDDGMDATYLAANLRTAGLGRLPPPRLDPPATGSGSCGR